MSHKSITDVISLLIKIQDTKQYLFNVTNNQKITLPSTSLVDCSWKETSNEFAKQIFSINPPNINICRIYRLYCPYQKYVMNIIYEVTLLSDMLSKCKIQSSVNGMQLQWMTHVDAIKNVWISQIYWKSLLFIPNTEHETFVCEITKDETIITTKNTDAPHYEMLCTVNITEDDQNNLYKEFMRVVWPENLMLINEFKTYCNIIFSAQQQDQDFIERLFHAGDVQNKNCLNFREVLYILAASQPGTPHDGSCLDIRTRFIFKYFDKGGKGYWDDADLKDVIQEMCEREVKQFTDADLEKKCVDAKKQILDIPRPRILLPDLISAVNELRFRGTSSLLRFKHRLKLHRFVEEKSSTKANQSIKLQRDDIQLPPQIAVHTLKFRNMGSIIDVDELWAMNTIVSPSSAKHLKNTKSQDRTSALLFQQNITVNEILKSLKHFSQEIISEDGTNGTSKDAYSWGTTPMAKFGNSLISICDKLICQMKNDPRCLQLRSPTYVIGDLHGNFPDLIGFERILWHLSPTLTPCNLLFLGDYVDRGPNSVEVVAYLFAYKYQNYNKVQLIRGNHEIRDIQRMFSFYAECTNKFGNNLGNKVWTAVNNVFDVMPLAAVIDTKIFACHGGIPPPWLLPDTYELINNVPCPLPLPDEQSQLAWSLLWNDPVKECTNNNPIIKQELSQNHGFARNIRRGTAYLFDETGLTDFLRKNNFTHVIRAHEVQPHGVSVQFSAKLISVFSSSNYCGMKNDAACLSIDSNRIRLLRMDVETFGKVK